MQQRSEHRGSITISYRDTPRYACVNKPFEGVHMKPQTDEYKARRKANWARRNRKALREAE